MTVIYLLGEHGIRTHYTEADAKQSEKDGYKRIDINEYMEEKRKKLAAPKKKAATRKASA